MNDKLIERIIPELRDELVGLAFRAIFQLRETQFAVAFEGDDFKLLFVAIEPKEPRIYLIKRRLRDLKKQQQNLSKFAVDLEKAIVGNRLAEVWKHADERIVEFRFESGANSFLIAQLTGKSSNLFLLDADRTIIAAARKPLEGRQSLGMQYSVPIRPVARNAPDEGNDFESVSSTQNLSESLDAHFLQQVEQEKFDALATGARRKNQKAQARLRRLIGNLEADVLQHGEPEKWKKYGDLLLASQSNARREAEAIVVRDLFDKATPEIKIDADDNDSIAETAQKYFRKYAKARNGVAEITLRIGTVRSQLDETEIEASRIECAVGSGDVEFLTSYLRKTEKPRQKTKQDRSSRLPSGVRSFRSSDGFEILVGKKAADNDFLTFRIARSRDTWMHAADYPGSHVVIRNNDRKPVPQKTLIEAAQLAAFYSQGKKQTKAAVNYTEKKFVDKPKKAAAGLVRLASFKTILVEPTFPSVSPT